MVQDEKNRQNVTTYEIDNKKYTVITKCIENAQNIDKLYDVICRYIVSKLNWNIWLYIPQKEVIDYEWEV